MKTIEDLYIEYARVIEMCRGTTIKPWKCVKGEYTYTDHPYFKDNKEWQFAIARVEDKPVFVGDVLYNSKGSPVIIREIHKITGIHESARWNIPKNTLY